MKNRKLPKDTNEIISEDKDIDNFYLKFHKTPFFDSDGVESKFYIYRKNKKGLLCKIKHEFDEENLKNICNNYYKSIEKLNLKIKKIDCITDGRLAVGLGSESVYETSMCLHYIYGFPYIPGQAVKGVLRNYIISEVFDGTEQSALNNDTFCRIFGSNKNGKIKKNIGNIVFFDVYPVSVPKFRIDIMNSHYSSYYGDKSNTIPPSDYDDTRPVNFMTVENTKFRFVYGIKKYFDKPVNDLWNESKEEFANMSIGEIVYKYLTEILEEHGIGAKTSVGYGYFRIDKEQEKKLKEEEELKEKEELKKEGKSDFEIRLYQFDKLLNKKSCNDQLKNNKIMEFYSGNMYLLKGKDKILLAIYMKKYLENVGEWKIKGNKKKKVIKKIKEIRDILKIDLPQ